MKKLTEEQKKANKLERQKNKELVQTLQEIEEQKNQHPVKEIVITVEWKRSRTWGNNPHAEAAVTFQNREARKYDEGFERRDGYTCSGWGYDKESTVIAKIFKDFLRYKLWNMSIEELKKCPYGISIGEFESGYGNTIKYRLFSGGIGTSCYYGISEFIGGKFEHIASGKTFDVYKYSESL